MSEAHKLKAHNVIPHGQIHRPNAPSTYIHQPFPTVRYGPGGATTTVHNEEELAALSAEWREFPYPAKPTGPVALAINVDGGLAHEHERLKEAHANLQQSHDALANDNATLKLQVEELAGQHKEALMAAQNATKQLNLVRGQLAAARKKDTGAAAAEPTGENTPEAPKD